MIPKGDPFDYTPFDYRLRQTDSRTAHLGNTRTRTIRAPFWNRRWRAPACRPAQLDYCDGILKLNSKARAANPNNRNYVARLAHSGPDHFCGNPFGLLPGGEIQGWHREKD